MLEYLLANYTLLSALQTMKRAMAFQVVESGGPCELRTAADRPLTLYLVSQNEWDITTLNPKPDKRTAAEQQQGHGNRLPIV